MSSFRIVFDKVCHSRIEIKPKTCDLSFDEAKEYKLL